TWKCTSSVKPYLLSKANHIPVNSSVDEHLAAFLNPDGFVLSRLRSASVEKRVLFLGSSFSGTLLTNLLNSRWDVWPPWVQSLCILGLYFGKRYRRRGVRNFLLKLGRAYIV